MTTAMTRMDQLIALIERYKQLGIDSQIDFEKFYLYSIITHSTAIEGSTVTEIENQLLFDQGITAKGKTIVEQMMTSPQQTEIYGLSMLQPALAGVHT